MYRLIIIFSLLSVLIFTSTSFALLENNNDGTITQTRNDGSILMWLQDANTAWSLGYDADGYMTWHDAQAWIDSLNNSNYLDYNDWRLPRTFPVNGSTYNYTWNYDGSTDHGYNIISANSEMAYLYYVELGNLGRCDVTGNCPQAGYGLSSTGPFNNLQSSYYWSGTDYALNPSIAHYFSFIDGEQNFGNKGYGAPSVWAVRVVPEPISSILFVTGGAFLAGRRYLRRIK